ncbi:nectin-2-like isoform X2 [Arapaima gigas]
MFASFCLPTVNQLSTPGPMTGSIIGGIITVILLLAIAGTVAWIFRKHRLNAEDADGPPKHKPPPPKKTAGSSGRIDNRATESETQPLDHAGYNGTEPVTNLDDTESEGKKNGLSEDYVAVLPAYSPSAESGPRSQPSEEGSFISSAMIV